MQGTTEVRDTVAPRDIWVFGYGSLMWRPGFAYLEKAPALLRGYRRRLCVVSRHHRGTAASPGLVMGLDRGGACRGIAYRVAAASTAATLTYLDEREIAHYPVYRRVEVPVALAGTGIGGARRVSAVTYVVDPSDADYAGRLGIEEQAAMVARSAGVSGDNRGYLAQVVDHIHALGLRDRQLEQVLAAVGR